MIQINECRITSNGTTLVIDANVRTDSYYEDVYIDLIWFDTLDTFISGGTPSSKAVKIYDYTNKALYGTLTLDLISKLEGLYSLGLYTKELASAKIINIYTGTESEPSEEEKSKLDITGNNIIDSNDAVAAVNLYNALVSKTDSKHILISYDIDMLPKNTLFFVYIITKGTPAANIPCGMKNSVAIGVAYNNYYLYHRGMNYIKELGKQCSVPRNFLDFILSKRAFELALELGHYELAIKLWKDFYAVQEGKMLTSNCGCHA